MITLSKVSKWYPNFQVLKHCSTEVAKGEVVVVCGPSGSGKSTLIKCVNGLEPVPGRRHHGRLQLPAQPKTPAEEAAQRRVTYVG
jgi:ABC-type polar amino acid transport system ATPase subunit